LHAAAWYGYWSLTELLLDYGADPDIMAHNGYTPLCVAVEADDLFETKLFASAGANLNHRISFSQNPLSLAVEKRNDSIVSFLRANNSHYNGWPSFNKFGLGTELNFIAGDFRWSFFLAASEKKYNLNLLAGWGFRPSAIRVLEDESEFIQYQYWERRGNLFLSIDKSVFFAHGNNDFQAGVYGGLKGIYTFGSYRGTGIKPEDRILAAPGAGLCMEGRFYRITAGYEYLNLDLYTISPHRINFSLSFMWNRKKNNFNPDFINW
ncbi:MAG: ankyrin repeat domain-containing protein, partial [Bacteroidales bacterium]|nr:ankyrin repeat domain-containing protein [Bacteroidales bacterium]